MKMKKQKELIKKLRKKKIGIKISKLFNLITNLYIFLI